MASNKFVYFMDGVSKTYPGGKKVFEKIRLNFLPGVKIGVVGVNGTGKSTLMRINPKTPKPQLDLLEIEFHDKECFVQ
jgi:ATPase subunit of ABC transporter with duplicated ATPase domains